MSRPTESLSCKVCRRRKIKCNRIHPCDHCISAGAECIFPNGRRRPRDSRLALLQRLQSLESTVHLLQVDLNTDALGVPNDRSATQDASLSTELPQTPDSLSKQQQDADDETLTEYKMNPLGEDFGRLQIRAGQSRYSSNKLWASLSQEIAEMRDLLGRNESEDDESELSHPPSTFPPPDLDREASSLLFKHSPSTINETTMHPTTTQMEELWAIYAANVDPVVKVFHRPSLRTMFHAVRLGDQKIAPDVEAALLSVYFAAVVSSTDERCWTVLRASKASCIDRYRHALEHVFNQRDLLSSSSLMMLQSFVLFLTSMRRVSSTSLVHAWCAIAVRIALSQGVHRDGSFFGLEEFEAEMRRRLWWHLVLMDNDLSEDHGVDPLVHKSSFDSKMPTNINDDEFGPDIKTSLVSRNCFTEMTPTIVRFEIAKRARKLLYTPPGRQSVQSGDRDESLQTNENIVAELQKYLDYCYLQYCDSNVAIQYSTIVLARSMCAMLWMSIYHPLHQRSVVQSDSLKDQLFISMTEVVDNIRRLISDPKTAQWSWFFHNDVQWPAVAYLLHELSQRSPGPLSDRAYQVVRDARTQWHAMSWTTDLNNNMRRPMQALTAKVLKQGGHLQVDPNSDVYSTSVLRERGWNAKAIEAALDPANFVPQDQTLTPNDFDSALQPDFATLDPSWFLDPSSTNGLGGYQQDISSEDSHFQALPMDWWFTPNLPS